MNDPSETSQVEQALHEHFFDGMSEAQLAKLVPHAQCVRFSAGDYVFRHDQAADDFYVLTRGKIALELASPRGPHVITTLGRGDVLGISWLFAPHFWKFDARCVDDCAAVRLDGEGVHAEFDADPALGCEIYRRFGALLANRLQATRIQLLDVYD